MENTTPTIWTIPTINAIGIGLGALLLGWLIGFLDKQRNQKKSDGVEKQLVEDLESFKRRSMELFDENKQLKDQLNAALSGPAPAQATGFLATPSAPTIDTAPLRVTQESDGWRVMMNGREVRAGRITEEERLRLLGILAQMRPWLDTQSAQAAPRGGMLTAAPAQNIPALTAPASWVQELAPDPAPVKPIKATPFASVRQQASAPPPVMGIVPMIDKILQKQIAGTPMIAQGVRMENGLSGEVVVVIGDKKYIGVDAVPDPEIKAAIQRAIETFNS